MGRTDTPLARTRARDDSGFTLVEAVVALFVLGIIFTALAAAAMGSLRASLVARVEQQGVDFATQALETVRSSDYYSLAHGEADLSADARVASCGQQACFDPGTGPEPLITSPSGTVDPHITQLSTTVSNNIAVTMATYVTDPADDADYKRVTVIASWSIGGVERERTVSSLVTATRRGLPLPVFKLTPLGGTAVSVNQGASAPFLFELTNQGAPDRWNLAFTGSGASEWALFLDDGDGHLDPSNVDIPLTNTNSTEDSVTDTGRIDPTDSIVFWAVRTVPGSTIPGSYPTTLTATSAAQAASPTGTASVDLTVQVVQSGTSIDDDPGGGSAGTAPGPPENLQLTTGNAQLVATWDPPLLPGSSEISDFVISYRLVTAQAWTVFVDGEGTSTTATITGLVNGSTYLVRVAAKNAAGEGAQTAPVEGLPEGGPLYQAPIRCPASATAPAGTTSDTTFNLRKYALHNRSAANPTWPGTGTVEATSTIGQGLPLTAAMDGPQVPPGTPLPVYSSDILDTEPGRILLAGGSFGSSDTTRVVDWRTKATHKDYKGTAVLGLWVAPVSIDIAEAGLPWSVTAQLYYRKSNGALEALGDSVTVSGPAGSFGTLGCLGWQEVWITFPVDKSVNGNEYIGARVWNSGQAGQMTRLRLAYDVTDDFFSYLTLPEKP